jgi:Papain-like cysteine protease AvrRpt2
MRSISLSLGKSTAYLLRLFLFMMPLFCVCACIPPDPSSVTNDSQARSILLKNSFISIHHLDDAQPAPYQTAPPVPPPVYITGNTIHASYGLVDMLQAMKNQPPPKTLLGIGLNQTVYVNGPGCVGDAGSVLPPLTFSCGLAAFTQPLTAMDHLVRSLTGDHGNQRHVGLIGIERFFFPQSKPTDCWAATLETSRAFLHLPEVSQDQILADATRLCPQIPKQLGASLSQIAHTIDYMEATYDKATPVKPVWCTDADCIIRSLTNQRPVIMLRPGHDSGHAVLLVGVDYDSNPTGNNPTQDKTVDIVQTLYILDPMNQEPTIQAQSLYEVCHADAFISY